MNASPILDIRGLSVKYGTVVALRDVDLTVNRGELIFVAGPNGSGKSTLLRAIAQDLRPSSGEIYFAGDAMTRSAPHEIVARGFTLVPEGREIFSTLSVLENLQVGAYLPGAAAAAPANTQLVLECLPDLKALLSRPAGLLSGGQQQMLAIGRALMTNASFIAIDEPSLGLAPKIIDGIYQVLLELQKRRGLTLLIAEQSFARAVTSAAKLVILRSGTIVRSGLAQELAADRDFQNTYFGF